MLWKKNQENCISRISAFCEYNSNQVNISGIYIFRAQFQSLKLCKEMLNASNICLFGIILTKWKYIYRSFLYYAFMYLERSVLMSRFQNWKPSWKVGTIFWTTSLIFIAVTRWISKSFKFGFQFGNLIIEPLLLKYIKALSFFFFFYALVVFFH